VKKSQLDQAIALGMTTQEELKAYELGYVVGERDTLQRKLDEAKEKLTTIPQYINDVIDEQYKKEKR